MIRYQGGKSRLAKYIVPIIKEHRKPGQLFIDLFVGGGWITERMENPRIANDLDGDLIALFSAVQHGWTPPTFVSEEMYAAAKEDGQDSVGQHIRAFIAFGCSWGGKKWGGYARTEGRNYAQESANACLAAAPLLEGALFTNTSFEEFWMPDHALVYADPPYFGTTQYKSGEFDYGVFLQTMLTWAHAGNTVFVSEQADFPSAFADKVWEKPYKGGIRKETSKPTEKLYRVRVGNFDYQLRDITNWLTAQEAIS